MFVCEFRLLGLDVAPVDDLSYLCCVGYEKTSRVCLQSPEGRTMRVLIQDLDVRGSRVIRDR